MILKSLKRALPSYVFVFLFITFLWLIFAVAGTAMFAKKMLHCYKQNEDLGIVSEHSCVALNGTLHSIPINFDSVGNTYIALLQVVCWKLFKCSINFAWLIANSINLELKCNIFISQATLQNWIDFVTEIMDNSNKVSLNIYYYYF